VKELRVKCPHNRERMKCKPCSGASVCDSVRTSSKETSASPTAGRPSVRQPCVVLDDHTSHKTVRCPTVERNKRRHTELV
jgi:hypothetical protein